ncbi:dystroglycan-like [Dorcoceras hygrometricum]|uniref:Dystroglycan-like n=1 Tax=Dorcoceras hygrometricum TaxID=472368 RepID=A0A2Z7B1C2_9LAMI|nr:dystroglycan-like [Dorcoceras hygrometricum]
MASSFYSNTQHIDFASVLAMNDPGMVSMFQALIAFGLEGFLGCTAVVYETALVDFFENASVRDGVIISTVAGQLVEISEEWFAEMFELPVDGLKSQMKIHYRLLCDIMAKSISVKAGSFNAITVEKFSLMTAVVCSVKMNWGRVLFGILKKMVTSGTKQAKGFAIQISLILANVPNLELGELSEFPSSKILTEKKVHRYIAVIDKSGAQDADVEPKATKASKKRTAAVPADVPMLDFVTEDPVVAKVDRVETWFDRVFDAELATADLENHDAGTIDCGDQSVDTTDEVPWFVRPFILADRDTKKLFETASDSENAMDLEVESQDLPVVRDTDVGTVGEKTMTDFGEQLMGTNDESSEDTEAEAVEKSADEAMSIDDIFMSIPAEVRLPSAGVEITKIIFEVEQFFILQPQEVGSFTNGGFLFQGGTSSRMGWKNFVPSKGSSAVDLKILNKLSSFHCLVLEELKTETLAHGLVWKQPCCSGIFEGETRDRGAVIARSNTNTRSSCWIRTMLRVDGAWIIEPCADRWVKIPRQISSCEVHCQRQYDDTLPSVSDFFRLLKKRWADVYLVVVEFCSSRRLLPVCSVNFCRGLPVGEPVFRVAPRHSPVFAFRVSQFFSVFIDYSVFSWLPSVDITDFLSSIALERTVLRGVQSSIVSAVVPSVQLSLDERQSSPTSADSSSYLHFDMTDLDATVSSLPSVPIDFSAALADFQATLSEQFNESQSGISSRLHKIEQVLRESLREQAEVFKNLFQGARQEGRSIDDVQTLRFNEFRKLILAQNASIFTGLADVRKEVQEVNAKVDIIASRVNDVRNNVEETKEALSHQLLEIQSQVQANQNILHAQLSELVNYINRGSADKKGESSSRGPQQPPNVQNLESGQSISLEDTTERIREADRRQAEMERERERQRRIRRLSGSRKRRRGY